ncbi:MAG: GntR family transcriptional regulator [Chloroflexi bacterium]|nr:GntR family transcriptional regulator [Chloroflexota bacterium]MCL5075922.1 GntR family transcriptional regulator [Chloroflexota bacterium]
MLDRNSPVPLYYQLSEILLNQITGGSLKPGNTIPTERELIEIYGVSRVTVRTAVEELVKRGYIRREKGRGTFVASPRIQRDVARLISFSEEILARGMKPGSRLLALRREPATDRVARELQVEAGELIWFVERLRLADAEPVALNLSYLRLPQGVTLTESELESEVSLWTLLMRKGITMAEGDKTIEAIVADEWAAKLLGVGRKDPLLLVEGVVYGVDGTPIEFHQIIGRADRYKYYLHVVR